MTSRQRGAALVLAVLVAGRVLDRLDLPFERRTAAIPAHDRDAPVVTPPDSIPIRAAATRAHIPSDAVDSIPPATTARRGDDPSATRPAAIRVNRAASAELQQLPGVGPVLAARIVDERRAHGPFRDLADLRRVKGIGNKIVERLAPLVRFD